MKNALIYTTGALICIAKSRSLYFWTWTALSWLLHFGICYIDGSLIITPNFDATMEENMLLAAQAADNAEWYNGLILLPWVSTAMVRYFS